MPAHGIQNPRSSRRLFFYLVFFGLLLGFAAPLMAESSSGDDDKFYSRSAVGGISIDADGILDRATVDQTGQLKTLVQKMVKAAPEGIESFAPMRKVSLRKLEKAIQDHAAGSRPISDEIRFLAGLQEIQYVFVDKENHDIVLAGPAEGWTVDQQGYVVGATTGRPVLKLEDLLVSLRAMKSDKREAISCSIDPTAEGVARLRPYVNSLRSIGNPEETAARIEKILGNQTIRVTGVPESSHFARVLVAADYQMKRIAMNLEPSPVVGLPSFLSMMKARGTGMANMMPRWWLEPRYESVTHSPDHLAWEFTGASVKAMTEEDFFGGDGTRRQTGKANPIAQRWADLMTEHYGQLASANPIFAQLQGCMNMAIVSTLIVRGNLTEKAGYSMPTLLDPSAAEVKSFPAPKEIASEASLLKRGRKWIVSASGGVEILPETILRDAKPNEALGETRQEAVAGDASTNWWWN